jgi:hypothetical protein
VTTPCPKCITGRMVTLRFPLGPAETYCILCGFTADRREPTAEEAAPMSRQRASTAGTRLR